MEKNFIIYKNNLGDVSARVLVNDNDIWMTQKEMAALFQIDVSGITKHLQNIFNSGELSEERACAKFALSQNSATFPLSKVEKFYNLSAIISVGYRVNSKKATDFRIWATLPLQEFIKTRKIVDFVGKICYTVAINPMGLTHCPQFLRDWVFILVTMTLGRLFRRIRS